MYTLGYMTNWPKHVERLVFSIREKNIKKEIKNNNTRGVTMTSSNSP